MPTKMPALGQPRINNLGGDDGAGRGGRVLAEVAGASAHYEIRGDEGYVRATVTDSNGRRAWTQPVRVGPRR